MGQRASIVLDLGRNAAPIKWIGPGKAGNTEWAVQNGIIFGWSESNMQYESVWWLNSDGTVDYSASSAGHIANLVRDRPFNPEWLK